MPICTRVGRVLCAAKERLEKRAKDFTFSRAVVLPQVPLKADNIRVMKIGNIYVPLLVAGAALLGAMIVALTFAGALSALPLWASSALCGASLMAVAFLVHYLLRARRLAQVVWEQLPDFTTQSDTFAEDVSKVHNPTADPLQLPRETTLFYMMGGGAFFGLLFTLVWLRWIGVGVAIVGAIVYAFYDYLPHLDRASREERTKIKKENSR